MKPETRNKVWLLILFLIYVQIYLFIIYVQTVSSKGMGILYTNPLYLR